jgi:hypothetical protein
VVGPEGFFASHPPEDEDRTMTRKLLGAAMLLGISGSVIAAGRDGHGSVPPACQVQGVWDLVAIVQAGKRTEFNAARQRKIVTKKNWMWLEAANRRDTLPLKTPLDSANYYATSGGFGTYEVSDHHYTEHIDLFVNPRYQGKNFVASCRVEGNQWFHTYLLSDIAIGPITPAMKDSVTEIWRRVE